MEHFLSDVLSAASEYWWLFVIALVVLHLLPSGPDVTGAIDEFKPDQTHGSARFADKKDLKKAGLFRGKGLPIGYSPDGRHELTYEGQGHVMITAAARMGKGLLIISSLLSWAHGCIIIDPKCENALVTAHARKRRGPVFILSPFKMYAEELGSMFARVNPMDILSCQKLSFHASSDKIAAALVWETTGGESKYFTDGARILVSGIIAVLKRHADPARQNLVEVARIIGSGDGLFTFCREAMQSSDPFIVQKLQRFALEEGKDPSKEMNDVIATAITNLGFMGNAAIAESLCGSSFRFTDIRKRKATVFICLPLSMLDVCDKYFRLILETALAELLDEGTTL